jgi:hypothetical protein
MLMQAERESWTVHEISLVNSPQISNRFANFNGQRQKVDRLIASI